MARAAAPTLEYALHHKLSIGAMSHYRAHNVWADGDFTSGVDLDCSDDEEAIEAAKKLIDGPGIELWQGDRKVIRLETPE
jgi:hypothetical protein